MTGAGFVVGSLVLGGLSVAIAWFVTKWLAGDAADLRYLRLVFVGALLLRCVLTVATYQIYGLGYFAPDEAATAQDAVHYLNNIPVMPVAHGQGWEYFNIFVYALFGNEPMLPRLWNCVAGALTAPVGYAVARDLGARRGARLAALLIAFFPSTAFWSILNLHDAGAYLVILCAFAVTTRLEKDTRWWRIVALGMLLFAIYLLRIFADLALLIAVVGGLVAWRWRISPRAAARGTGAVIVASGIVTAIALLVPQLGHYVYVNGKLDRLAGLRETLASGARSAVDVDPGLGNFAGIVGFVPRGVVDFLLRPFPWEHSTSTVAALTRPEVVFYYALLPLLVMGMVLAIRKNFVVAVPPLVFLALSTVGYSLVLSNLGTIYRERDELLVVMFTFSGLAADQLAPWLRVRFRGFRRHSRDVR